MLRNGSSVGFAARTAQSSAPLGTVVQRKRPPTAARASSVCHETWSCSLTRTSVLQHLPGIWRLIRSAPDVITHPLLSLHGTPICPLLLCICCSRIQEARDPPRPGQPLQLVAQHLGRCTLIANRDVLMLRSARLSSSKVASGASNSRKDLSLADDGLPYQYIDGKLGRTAGVCHQVPCKHQECDAALKAYRKEAAGLRRSLC